MFRGVLCIALPLLLSTPAVGQVCYSGRCQQTAGWSQQSFANVERWEDSDGVDLIEHPTFVKALEAINADRKRNGRQPLRYDPTMCVQAQRHSEWMLASGYYQHSRLPYMECIYRSPRYASTCVAGWIASPAHHGIMLSGSVCGLGYAKGRNGFFWTLVVR